MKTFLVLGGFLQFLAVIVWSEEDLSKYIDTEIPVRDGKRREQKLCKRKWLKPLKSGSRMLLKLYVTLFSTCRNRELGIMTG